MDVADRIVVMDHGRIEQEGSPRDLYEHPANEFVMSFIGPVNRLGAAWVRPHDIDVLLDPTEGATEAMIDRIVYLGFEVRVELTRQDGSKLSVQVPRDEVERLELTTGQIVFARASRERVFDPRPMDAEVEAVAAG